MSIYHPPTPGDAEISELPKGNHEQLPYGIHILQLESGLSVALASASNFETLLTQLEEIGNLDRETTVLTPELITEIDSDKVRHDRGHVMGKIDLVQELSVKFPKLKILLGTPYWTDQSTCYNTVLVIQADQILQTISKTYLTSGEDEDFAISQDDNPTIAGLDSTQLLICSDLNAAGANLETLIAAQVGKTTPVTDHPQMISPDTKVLLVSACWGSGSNTTRELLSQLGKVKSGKITIDDYSQVFFQAMLNMAINRTFLAHPSLELIVVCDRAPVERGLELGNTITSHKPLNGVFHRHTSSSSV